ncbi:hypothetical protein EJ73_02831 [Hoylesella shahii DSM 15611 = JCM 12083]|uniref:Uncharacterized protein n=1 Tax=Hoylesella shahii DSM 15611 = JCM 12083 TaxID=1122991 RepID=A0A318I4G8_9BACT|nr:hypothetical protein EJ73_02831 [Hoylesella shahii DSM 15611 = JCM 12083]
MSDMGLKHFYISNQYAQELSCRQKFLAANRINFSNEFIRVKARLIFDWSLLETVGQQMAKRC